MAVVQDGAATAARAGKPLCAAAVSVSAVCIDLRWVNCAMVQAVRLRVQPSRGQCSLHPDRTALRPCAATPVRSSAVSGEACLARCSVSATHRPTHVGSFPQGAAFSANPLNHPGAAYRRPTPR
jgi:hypothetical protein